MNSELVEYTIISPNTYGPRDVKKIDRITIHCVVGQCSASWLGEYFFNPGLKASSNYGIGSDGAVGLYVLEENAAQTSSSKANDMRAITIECASDSYEPYKFNECVYKSLIDLCVDICKRHGKDKVIWLNDKENTENYTPKPNEMVLTVHRWYTNRTCPGEWMYSRLGEFADTVTEKLNKKPLYRVQVGAFHKWTNAQKYVERLKRDGYDAFVTVNK